MTRAALFVTIAVSLGYPLAIYASLVMNRDAAPWLVLLMAVVHGGVSLKARRGRAPFRTVTLPILMMAVAVVSLLSRRASLSLALPTLISVLLFVLFATTLRTERPMLERFARLQTAELTPGERAHCRQFTRIWMVFFLLNGGLTAALALWAPLDWWVAYAGAISYVLIGFMFATEYVLRRVRFRGFGKHFPDRVLERILAICQKHEPPRGEQ